MHRAVTKGFIALVSVLIISAAALAVLAALGLTRAYERFNALDDEYKEESIAAAESCANALILAAMSPGGYQGDPLTLGDITCEISSYREEGEDMAADVGATVHRSKSLFSLLFSPADGSMLEWKEIPSAEAGK